MTDLEATSPASADLQDAIPPLIHPSRDTVLTIRRATPQNSPLRVEGPLTEAQAAVHDDLRERSVDSLMRVFHDGATYFDGMHVVPQLPASILKGLLSLETADALRIACDISQAISGVLDERFPESTSGRRGIVARETLSAFDTDLAARITYAQHQKITEALRRGESVDGASFEPIQYTFPSSFGL